VLLRLTARVRELPTGTVTFLFTDIEGSTRLLKRLGARYADVLEEHHRLLRMVFAEFDGREVDTQGDALFVAFPRAKDAVGGAVAAQQALAAHAWPDGVDVRVRMGLHTGEPIVGTDRYVGLGIHTAARICSAGHGGQVLLSSVTRGLVEDDLPERSSLRDLGEHLLKDLERPERLFQLAVEGLPHQFPALKTTEPRAGSAFVGRTHEVGELVSYLEDALSGRGRLVLVAGEPGIGKSRLADELAIRASSRGARILVGRSWEAGGAPAFWPWVQALRSYIREAAPDALRAELGGGAADVAQILPELAEILTDLPAPPSLESDGARFRLFDSMSSFLRNAATSRPLVVILDDLHGADASSLLLLQFVAGELAESNILILGCYRDVDPALSGQLASTLAQLSRERVTRIVPLPGFGEPDVASFIKLTTGVEPTESLVRSIRVETEGNPLFVGELLRLLASEGRLAQIGGETTQRLAIPQGVRSVIGRRLDRLSPECTHVLTLASVLGREFSLDALELVSEHSRETLLEVLDEAAVERVVDEVPGAIGRLRFAHTLIRDTLYEELPATRRVRLHARVGKALEALYSDNAGPHLAELAHHFFEAASAGTIDEAIDYAVRAADRAASALAFEEAVSLYRMALRLTEDHGAARCEILIALGEAQARAGDTPAAKVTFREAADLAESRSLPEQLARAALGYGGRLIWDVSRDDPHLVPLLQRALAALGDEDSDLRVRLLARLAGGPLRDSSADPEQRRSLAAQALEMARRIGEPSTLAYGLHGYISSRHSPDFTPEQADVAGELIEVALRADELERVAEGHEVHLLSAIELGDISSAYADVEALTRLADELRQPAQRWVVAVYRALLALLEGRFEEAEQLVAETRSLGARPTGWNAEVVYALQLYLLRREQGRLQEVEELVRRAVTDNPTYPVWRCVLTDMLAELGSADEARAELDSLAADGFTRLPFDEEWEVSICFLAHAAARLGERQHAASLYELLLPYAERVAVSYPEISLGPISRFLAMLATAMGQWGDAERHVRDSLELSARIGARASLAHSHAEYAAMLLERDEPSDTDKAWTLLDQALAIYRELGMDSHARRAVRLRERATTVGSA
jgi:eukaryotic-like serine/threonine-protein kinase